MPTNMKTAGRTYGIPIEILADSDQIAFKSVGVDLASLVSDADGKKFLPAGTFLQEPFTFTPAGSPTPVQVSVLQFAKIQSAIVGNTINLGERGLAFLPGMQLVVPAGGYNSITLSGTIATGDTVTFTLMAGVTAVATAVAAETLATMAAKLAAAINSSQGMARYVSAMVNGNGVSLLYHTDKTFTSSVAKTGTIAAPALLDPNRLADLVIGTVQSVSNAGVITLTAAPAQQLPVGFPLTRPFNPNSLMGITIEDEMVYEYSTNTIDPMVGEANDVAAYHRATIHRARIPFWSSYYSTFLPELKFFPN